ncbi:MAG TPA: hypothetical protein VL329_04625, partial [Nitrospiraceae bacterium]|nr:hypothetical protein [Nitrospiraceae bacterium]
NRRALEKATEEVKRSAGAIFDAMFIKGENVFTSLKNLLKGGALSLGRSIFEDISGALLGPIKKAFDDFFTGLIDGIGIKTFLSGLGSKLGGLLGGGGGLPTLFGQGGTGVAMSAAGTGGIGGAGGAAGGAGGLFSGLGTGLISGGIAAAGSLLSTMRLEGTMNAVEYNTRVSRIHLGVMIDQLFWPWDGIFHFMADKIGEQVNQLDAIYNAIIGQGPMSAQPAYAVAGNTNNNVVVNMNITSNNPLEIGQAAVKYIKTALKTDRDGIRSNIALVAKQTAGIVSTVPQG